VIDGALNGALQEIKLLATLQPAAKPAPAAVSGPKPTPSAAAAPAAAKPATAPAPTAPAKPAAPPAMVDGSVLEKVLALAEEALGELGTTIYENQYADHKINPQKLTRDAALRFCYALQKDAAMIIGPSAAKKMADKMMALLK